MNLRRASNVGAIFVGLLVGAGNAGFGQVRGNLERQERGDLEWRRLQLLINDHPAVYDFHAVGDPRDKTFHFLIEMEGPTLLVRDLTLQNFVDDGPEFFGAYMRSGGLASRASRLDIIETTRQLRDLRNIGYVDDFRDYIYVRSLGTNGRLDPEEIIGMRSDAFAEYVYAFNGLPIVVLNGSTLVTNPGLFQDQSRSGVLTPRTQRTAMAASTIENPVAMVRDARGVLIDTGGITNSKSITVDVVDERSGPGRLEVWKGNPDAGGTRLAASFFDFPVDGIRYVYTSRDQGLAILGDLPEGHYTIRAIDQAGNYGGPSVVSFVITRPPLVSLGVRTSTNIVNTFIKDAWGASNPVASVVGTNFEVTVKDPVGGITIVPGGQLVRESSTEKIVAFSGLTPGEHAVTATNANGAKTVVKWKSQNLGFMHESSAVTFVHGQPASMNISASLSVLASGGISIVERLNGFNVSQVLQRTQTPAVSITTNLKHGDLYPETLHIRDLDGNSSMQPFNAVAFVTWPRTLRTTGSESVSHAFSWTDVDPGPGTVVAAGGVMLTGEHSITGPPSSFTAITAGYELAEEVFDVPLTEDERIGTYIIRAGDVTLVEGTVRVNEMPNTSPATRALPLPVSVSVRTQNLQGTAIHRTFCEELSANRTRCAKGRRPTMTASVTPAIFIGTTFIGESPFIGGTGVFPGQNQTVHLKNGIRMVGVNVRGHGFIDTAVTEHRLEPGWVSATPNSAFAIHDPQSAVTGEYDLHLPYTPGSLSPELEARAQVAAIQRCDLDAAPARFSDEQAVARTSNSKGLFVVAASEFEEPALRSDGACRFHSADPAVHIAAGATGAGHAQALNVFRSQGLAPSGITCDYGPTDAEFSPAGVIKICLDDDRIADAQNMQLYQFNEAGLQEEIAPLFVDAVRGFVAGRVSRFSSLFNVFAATTAVPASDLLPPRTSLLVNGSTQTAHTLSVRTDELISFEALDPTFPGAPRSGVAEIRYGVNIPTDTPGVGYSGPFTLPEGSHALFYYSVDAAGNEEARKIVQIDAVPPEPNVDKNGLAAAWDGTRLWLVSRLGEQVRLSRYGPTGSVLSTVVLPDANDAGDWSLTVGASGYMYAVGTSSGPLTTGIDVAVYKVSPDGVLVSSAGFTTTGTSDDIALDASGDVWISGAYSTPQGTFELGLWRYCLHGEKLALKGTYSRGGGLDGGFAVQVLGADVWVLGYSQNPASGRLDLALWRFDQQGVLRGEPFFRSDAAQGLDDIIGARLAAHPAGLYAAAAVGGNLAFFSFDPSGRLRIERRWIASEGPSRPSAIGLGDGFVRVAGDAAGRIAAWDYAEDGTFLTARADGDGAATDMALAEQATWLSILGSTMPYRFIGDSPLAGTDVLVSSRSPPALSVSAVRPASGRNDQVVRVDIDGTGFEEGTTAALTRGAQRIQGSSVSLVSATLLIVSFNLTSQATGHWTVTVAHPDGRTASLPNAFLIEDVPPADAFSTRLDPETLNLKSQGNYVTLTLVSGSRAVSEIAASSLRIIRVNDALLAAPIAALSKPKAELSGNELSVKLDRQLLGAVLPPGEQARLLVSGLLSDGSAFEAEAFIRTIHSIKADKDKSSVAAHPTSGAAVSLPAGALSADLDVTVVKVAAQPRQDAEAQKRAAEATGVAPVGALYDFGPDGTQFARPVTLALPYDPAAVADPFRLKIGYWNPARSAWEALDSSVDIQRRVVTARTAHFSQYQLIAPAGGGAPPAPGPSAADGAFVLRELFAFPNPARDRVTIRLKAGQPDSMQVNVFDVSGQRVHSGSTHGASIVDGEWVMDHVWETGRVGSGVYYFTVTAKKAGHGDIRKVGKVGVVK